MKEEKHSDQIFRDKLENFSVEPPTHVWIGIQDQLVRNRRNRRIIAIRWISAAAAILLAFLGGWYFSHNSKTPEIVKVESNITQHSETTPENNVKPDSKGNDIISVAPDHELIAKSENTRKATVLKQKTLAKNTNEVVLASAGQNPGREIINMKSMEQKKSFFEIFKKGDIQIRQNENIAVPDLTEADRALIASNAADIHMNDKNEARWKLGMMLSPGYSSQVSSHSESYSSTMIYSSDKGNVNMTGGISVQLQTGKRWSVESGVYYDQNGQKSQSSFQLFGNADSYGAFYPNSDKEYFANDIKVSAGSIKMNSTAGVIAMSSTPRGAEVSGTLDSAVPGSENELVTSGDFSQVFDFIEIPLYLRYKLLDSKVGVEMMGGINAGLLVGNNAYVNNEFGVQNIGKTLDISPFSFSGTIGIGLDYQLSEHFSLGAEPRFNYFLNSINNNPDVNFRPYRFGFYTGIYYEF